MLFSGNPNKPDPRRQAHTQGFQNEEGRLPPGVPGCARCGDWWNALRVLIPNALLRRSLAPAAEQSTKIALFPGHQQRHGVENRRISATEQADEQDGDEHSQGF